MRSSTHLLGVLADLSDDDGWEINLFPVQLVSTDGTLLDKEGAQRLELLYKELGHVLDILDIAGIRMNLYLIRQNH